MPIAILAEGGGAIVGLIQLLVMVLVIVSLWKVFVKAGQPGWAAIIPIYNVYVWLQIVNRPVWWLLLLLVPIVNIVVFCVLTIDLAKAFGQTMVFGICMIFFGFVCYPVLAFGDAQYTGVPSR